MSTKLIYNEDMAGVQLLDYVRSGKKVFCPKCGAELVVALDDEIMTRLKVHQGIYCSNDFAHVAVYIEVKLPAEFWEQFDKKSK